MARNIEADPEQEGENPQDTKAEKLVSDGIQEEHDIVSDGTTTVEKEMSKSTSLGSQKQAEEGEDKEQQETGEEQENKKEPEEQQTADEFKYVEEPPPDPAEPYNLTDSSEALKPPFDLRPDQMAELEDLWELYQDYTPAYTDINGYITEKELVYMLKSLFLMPYTPEQLQELIAFCVRPPHPEGHIDFDQFVKIATIRYRDTSIVDNLRSALQALDEGEGLMNRDNMREILTTMGHKMPMKQVNLLIKEVDIRNDGLIGIEDVMATICIDLIFE